MTQSSTCIITHTKLQYLVAGKLYESFGVERVLTRKNLLPTRHIIITIIVFLSRVKPP